MNPLGRRTMAALVLAMSASAAPLTAQREAEVHAATTTTTNGTVVGHTTRVAVRLARNRSHVPSVGVMEASASGAGDQWLTTLWQAAFVATEATDSSLLDFEFTLRVEDPIDGPSAGLLTTATLTALIRGKKLLPHTTITGSVNPDGSAGPVDDVLVRLRAAAADGVKRFGFPLGGRQQVDASGAMTDLVVEGQRLGVEVKELGSLDEAYRFLTGEALPRPVAATDAEMELWPAELAALTGSPPRCAPSSRPNGRRSTPHSMAGVRPPPTPGASASNGRPDRPRTSSAAGTPCARWWCGAPP